ncbi:MAG TPA: c-type cytochrome [Thermoanaerobaculia bacterium]|nr:c-type cytochrome [Thermoanaerobaculia bacterium]
MRRWWVLLVFILSLSVHAQPLKNVQILTGLSRPELQRVMNEMAAGLGVHCHYCHANDDSRGASDTKPQKARAREMIRMVMDLNARHFGGQPVVTCFTCHNGKPHPALTPPLPQAVPAEPVTAEPKLLPTAAAVIQKYVAAVGRELAPETPRLFKGTHKSPTGPPIKFTILNVGEQSRGEIQLPDGSLVTQGVEATGGWIRDKNGVRDMTPEELVTARMSRRAFAPFYTSAIGDDARVTDSETIGDRSAWVVRTATARYWFDSESGLLLRRVVYYNSPVGRIPEQTDFDDYRDVGALKLPFVTRVALVDPWSGGLRQAETIQVGVAIAPGEFEKPAPGGGSAR